MYSGSCTEAHEFLSRHGDGGGQTIVRMRGLPYTCKAEQVVSNNLKLLKEFGLFYLL